MAALDIIYILGIALAFLLGWLLGSLDARTKCRYKIDILKWKFRHQQIQDEHAQEYEE